MARHKVDDEVEALRKRRDEIEKRLRVAQERQRRKEQQINDKRRLLAGGVMVAFTDANPDDYLTRRFLELLDRHITRAQDRDLFPALAQLQTAAVNADKPDAANDNQSNAK
jgi:hypothetical protein